MKRYQQINNFDQFRQSIHLLFVLQHETQPNQLLQTVNQHSLTKQN